MGGEDVGEAGGGERETVSCILRVLRAPIRASLAVEKHGPNLHGRLISELPSVPTPHRMKELLADKEATEKHAKESAVWIQREQAKDAQKN